MEGEIGCKGYFLYLNATGIVVSAIRLVMLVLFWPDSEDTAGQCVQQKTGVDQDALNVAQLVFGLCGIIAYPLGIFGTLKKNKKALQCYIAGMAVISIVHVALFIISLVQINNLGIEKDPFIECFEDRVDDFYENVTVTDEFLIDNFQHYNCCYPDGDMVEFWKNTNWYPNPTLKTGDIEVPIQCCKNNQSGTCRRKGGDIYRLKTSCLEAQESVLTIFQLITTVPSILVWGLALCLDLFLVNAVHKWLKKKPEIQHEEPTNEPQEQTRHPFPPAYLKNPPPHQPGHQVQGQTQPVFQPEYQHAYHGQGLNQPTDQAQIQATSPAYQPQEQLSPGDQPRRQSSSTDQLQEQSSPAYMPQRQSSSTDQPQRQSSHTDQAQVQT